MFFAVALIAGYFYFDVGVRWQLSGTWACEQYNNGYPTTETFGFFGSRETVNEGSDWGTKLHTIGRFTLSGKEMVSTPKIIERGNRALVVKDDATGGEIHLTEIISKLSGSELVYVLRPDNHRATMISCHR